MLLHQVLQYPQQRRHLVNQYDARLGARSHPAYQLVNVDMLPRDWPHLLNVKIHLVIEPMISVKFAQQSHVEKYLGLAGYIHESAYPAAQLKQQQQSASLEITFVQLKQAQDLKRHRLPIPNHSYVVLGKYLAMQS